MSRPALILLLLLVACSSATLESADSQDRIAALQRAASSGDRTRVREILPSLSSGDPLVRWTAQRALLALTGTTLDYDWTDPAPRRIEAIERWRVWCNSNLPDTERKPS
jgi:hypothetical protein